MILYTTYVAWCLDLDLIFSKLLLQWMVDEKELRVIHYTLGPLKPWDWWTAWLVKPVGVWQVMCHFVCLPLPSYAIFQQK
jgi:hypothetical protein